jgi:hypothetical protein
MKIDLAQPLIVRSETPTISAASLFENHSCPSIAAINLQRFAAIVAAIYTKRKSRPFVEVGRLISKRLDDTGLIGEPKILRLSK